jgi:hypothetical protein
MYTYGLTDVALPAWRCNRQVDLEGDTVRVYRKSMLQGSFGQISALKEREEKKICDKLKDDLSKSAFAAGMNERELPKIEKPKPGV